MPRWTRQDPSSSSRMSSTSSDKLKCTYSYLYGIFCALMISILLVHGPDIIPKCQALAANNNNRKQRTPLMRRIRSILPPKFPLALPWYEEGLEFECTGCSKCCQVDGDVWLAPEEVTSIANYLQKTDEDDIIASIDAFRKKYVRAELSPADDDGDDGDEDPSLQSQSSSWMCLKRTKEGACTFLDPSGKCSIYDVRPVQCSTYPFWPSLLEDPEAWEEESVLPDDVPLENGNNADNTRRHWSPEHGGCEGIGTSIGRIMDTVAQLDEKDLKDVDLNRLVQEQQQEAIMVEREEIQAKRKKAKRHWRRFPGEDIKMSTWYL